MPIPDLIVGTAQAAGVDPALALEIATAESGLDPNARGAAGEIGVFQLLPSSFPSYTIAQLADPQTNITLGVGYLASMLAQFGDPVAAVAAYNAGPGAVQSALAAYGVGNCPGGYPAWLQALPGSTQGYVERIFGALGSKYTVCVAGVPIPIISAAPEPSLPGSESTLPITPAGLAPSSGWMIAIAIAGLALWVLF